MSKNTWVTFDPKTLQQAVDDIQMAQKKLGWMNDIQPPGFGFGRHPQPPALTPEMFEDAIAHINEHGWCQGADVQEDGSVCLRGAFGRALAVQWQTREASGTKIKWGNRPDLETATLRAQEVLKLMGVNTRECGSLQDWNDMPGRTKEQVIDALTLAAKTLRERGV